MQTNSLPFVEDINFQSLNKHYHIETMVLNHRVQIELNFEQEKLNEDEVKVLANFLLKIEYYHTQNLIYIVDDLDEEESEAYQYFNYFMNEFDDEELGAIIDLDDESISVLERLFRKMQLEKLSIFPHDSNVYAIFEYTINDKSRNEPQFLVLALDRNQQALNLTWEH